MTRFEGELKKAEFVIENDDECFAISERIFDENEPITMNNVISAGTPNESPYDEAPLWNDMVVCHSTVDGSYIMRSREICKKKSNFREVLSLII
jgi:hypothetical protein